MQKKYAENYSIIVSFLHQTYSYKFIRKRAMTGQKFRQWSDDIKPEDDITPFDGLNLVFILRKRAGKPSLYILSKFT